MKFNIYFGTIGNSNTRCKYRYTAYFNTEEAAIEKAHKEAENLYYKLEGTHGLSSFNIINKESKITEKSLSQLYTDHINDMMRWYAIPTNLDIISNKNIKYQ